jgi:hypothetical protein
MVTVSGCRVLAIIGCGPRPIIADAPPVGSPTRPPNLPRCPAQSRRRSRRSARTAGHGFRRTHERRRKKLLCTPSIFFFRQCRCCRWPLDGHHVLRPQASLDHLGGVVERVRRTPNPDLRHQRAKLGTHPLGMPQPCLVVVREHRYHQPASALPQAARHVPAPCGTATALIPSPASTEASCSPSHKVIQPPGRDAFTGKDQIRASRPVGPRRAPSGCPPGTEAAVAEAQTAAIAELDLRKFASNAIRPGTGLRITCRAETTAHRTTGGM